jgi:hypothetical protein
MYSSIEGMGSGDWVRSSEKKAFEVEAMTVNKGQSAPERARQPLRIQPAAEGFEGGLTA